MGKLIFLLFLFAGSLFANRTITPSDVYAEVMDIKKEIHLIKEHFNIKKKISAIPITAPLEPRHAWQKTYEIIVKINMLRDKFDLPIIEPSNMQPVLKTDPSLTYEQTQRILTELKILKKRFSIDAKVSSKGDYYNKKPTDVYNLLNEASLELDTLNGKAFNPSYVFGETMRIYDDISIILHSLNINNETIPPKRVKDSKPQDSYHTGTLIINKINKLKRDVNLKVTNFDFFKKKNVTPSDVFSLNQVIISELQVLKAYLDLSDYVTTPAKKYQDKTPTDVNQLLGWCLRSIKLIKNLEKSEQK